MTTTNSNKTLLSSFSFPARLSFFLGSVSTFLRLDRRLSNEGVEEGVVADVDEAETVEGGEDGEEWVGAGGICC